VRILYDMFANPPLVEGSGTEIDPAKPGLMIELLHMAAAQAHLAILDPHAIAFGGAGGHDPRGTGRVRPQPGE
jgi:hypothetical protein